MTPTGTEVKVRLLRIAPVVRMDAPVMGLPILTVLPEMLEIVPPGAMPGPLTNIPVERPVVPARVRVEVPLEARAIWEMEAGPPEKSKAPDPLEASGAVNVTKVPETLATVPRL